MGEGPGDSEDGITARQKSVTTPSKPAEFKKFEQYALSFNISLRFAVYNDRHHYILQNQKVI
jgi:hypothetical protein